MVALLKGGLPGRELKPVYNRLKDKSYIDDAEKECLENDVATCHACAQLVKAAVVKGRYDESTTPGNGSCLATPCPGRRSSE